MISIKVTPVFKEQSPFITLSMNEKILFEGHLKESTTFEHLVHESNIQIKIKRIGRTKAIIKKDPENGFTISDLEINGVAIDPSIGSYNCDDNDWLDPHTIHGKDITLNGEYILNIPKFTLLGEVTKNLDRFNMKGVQNKYCFFGASMTRWDFSIGIPPMHGKKNYAELFIEKFGGLNLSTEGQTNQEVVETVYKYLDNNKCNIAFVQLISAVVRQVKNKHTKEIIRYSPHTDKISKWHDEFTDLKVKTIQEYFVNLNVAPIIALQIPDYQRLIEYAKKRGTNLYIISYFRDEYEIYKKVFPNNVAPYFDIDPNSEYCLKNGYHATVEEQEAYFQNLVDFSSKIT